MRNFSCFALPMVGAFPTVLSSNFLQNLGSLLMPPASAWQARSGSLGSRSGPPTSPAKPESLSPFLLTTSECAALLYFQSYRRGKKIGGVALVAPSVGGVERAHRPP